MIQQCGHILAEPAPLIWDILMQESLERVHQRLRTHFAAGAAKNHPEKVDSDTGSAMRNKALAGQLRFVWIVEPEWDPRF